MFHAVVSVTLADRRAACAIMQCHADLPFAPSPGIELGWVDGRTAEWSGQVETIIWSVAEQRFHIEMEDWISSRLLLDEMVAELGPAWRRVDKAA